MSTRISNGTTLSASGNLSRRPNGVIEREPQGGATLRKTTISFTAPGTIADSGNGFGAFRVNDTVDVRGSAKNSREYRVTAAAAGSLTVSPALVQSEGAGPIIIVSRV